MTPDPAAAAHLLAEQLLGAGSAYQTVVLQKAADSVSLVYCPAGSSVIEPVVAVCGLPTATALLSAYLDTGWTVVAVRSGIGSRLAGSVPD